MRGLGTRMRTALMRMVRTSAFSTSACQHITKQHTISNSTSIRNQPDIHTILTLIPGPVQQQQQQQQQQQILLARNVQHIKENNTLEVEGCDGCREWV